VVDIHYKKGLKSHEKILDFMGSTELIANLFRISQTEEKIRKDRVDNKDTANETHYVVGKEIRQAIERVGGTMPENLPIPDKSITEIERDQLKKLKKSKNKLMLDK
jgi:DNA-damage-inducible protein D